jgi:hypothetical protein
MHESCTFTRMKLILAVLCVCGAFYSDIIAQQVGWDDVERQKVEWAAHKLSFEVPASMEKVYTQQDECGASGDGIKLEMVYVGHMNITEELSFFEGILVFQHQDPTDVWPATYPARLISGYYGKVHIYILAFNNHQGEAFAAIAYFDDDNAVKEAVVRQIFKSIQFSKT